MASLFKIKKVVDIQEPCKFSVDDVLVLNSSETAIYKIIEIKTSVINKDYLIYAEKNRDGIKRYMGRQKNILNLISSGRLSHIPKNKQS